MRRSTKSHVEFSLSDKVAETLFLVNEKIAVEHVRKLHVCRGIDISRNKTKNIVPDPKMEFLKQDPQLTREIFKKMKTRGDLEYIRYVDTFGNPIQDAIFCKQVLKWGFLKAYITG